jgi:outer membrane protein assembly factor BamB
MKVGKEGLTEIWRNKNMSNQCNSSVLYEGHLYGFSGDVGGKGKLRCLDLETGEIKWTKDKLGTGSLLIADKKLIVLSEDGHLVIAEAKPDAYQELQRARILKGLCWTVPVLCKGKIYARCAEGDLVCVDPGTKK